MKKSQNHEFLLLLAPLLTVIIDWDPLLNDVMTQSDASLLLFYTLHTFNTFAPFRLVFIFSFSV